MAEDSDGQERTEKATSKKLQDARQKGQVPRSRELSTMMGTISGAAILLVMGKQFSQGLLDLLNTSFSESYLRIIDPALMPGVFYGVLVRSLVLFLPLMLTAMLAALAASIALGGWTFNLEFKLERVDPIKGMQKLFSLRSLVELGKSLAKLVFIGLAAIALLSFLSDQIFDLGLQPAEQAVADGGGMVVWFFLLVSLPLIVIAAIDVPWQLWSYHKELRMTRQEVRDEQKETDGRPEVKQKIREMQQAAAQRRMMEEVPKADVVITNPTHYAIALKYEEARNRAPVVVAKGADVIAGRIREIAAEHEVPLVESPRLTRAVYATTDIGGEIPTGLYLAVAQILAYVYQLRDWEVMGGEFPEPPEPEVDSEYLKGFND